MKQTRDFVDDSLNGRRFLQGVVIAILASAAIIWSACELFDMLMAAARSKP